MGVFSKFQRFHAAGEQANVNNVAKFGEPVHSLFTTTKLLSLHHHIDITDAQEQVVYQARSKMISLHDKTDVFDAAGNAVAHIERISLFIVDFGAAKGIKYNVFFNFLFIKLFINCIFAICGGSSFP